LPRKNASTLLSTLVGALVVSNALGDLTEYGRATEALAQMPADESREAFA